MLIIDSVKKIKKKKKIHGQMKTYFSRVISGVPRVFFSISLYITAVYLGGTEEPSPWLEALSVNFLEFRLSRLVKMHFPACSKVFLQAFV